MSKFTKGKWEAHPNRVMVNGYPLALVNGGNAANVRLIAAAPEMYELLFSLFNVAEYVSPLELINTHKKWDELLTRIDGEEEQS